jgi:uncharacterized protein
MEMHKTSATESERRCIVAGLSFPPEKLIRFVVGPDNQIVADLEEKLPGRGFWLSADLDMVNTACDKKLFNKAARCSVTVSASLAEDLENLLVRRCLDRVALARRARQAVGGFDRVTEKLKAGGKWRGGILLAASDGAADGRNKIRRLAEGMDVISLFSAAELGSAIGSERTVHLIIESGGLARTLRRDTGRLAGFRRDAGLDDGDDM